MIRQRSLFYMSILFLVVFSAFSDIFPTIGVYAQPEADWEKTYGGLELDIGESVQQTIDGGYIIGGKTNSFGWGNDVYIVKTTIDGHELWSKTFGGPDWDKCASIQQTNDEGYIILGYTCSYGVGGKDVYLIKIDKNGNHLWSKTFGGTNDDDGFSIEQTSDNGYIIAARTDSFGAGNVDFYVIKTDKNGIELWSRTYGGLEEDSCDSVRQTVDGGYIIVGSTRSFGVSGSDVYLVKIKSNGDKEWEKTFGGSENDWGREVIQTNEGGYIIVGGTKSFGAGLEDVYVVKTDSNGNIQWTNTFGGSAPDEGKSIKQTKDGGYIISGYTSSTGSGAEDAYLVKTDSEGNSIWQKTFGGENLEWGLSVYLTTDGGYILAGYTESFGEGNGDIYLIKIESEALWSLRELKDEINELPNIAFKKTKHANNWRKTLLRKITVKEILIKRGNYNAARQILKQSIKRQITKRIVEPWRSDLLDWVSYTLDNIPYR